MARVKVSDFLTNETAVDLLYPVGIVSFFGKNKNPNLIWPGTKWVYTGTSKYIRIGAVDGTDVGKAGGSNSFTIGKANLPNVTLTFSGTTSNFDYGSKGTNSAGDQSVNTSSAGGHVHTIPHSIGHNNNKKIVNLDNSSFSKDSPKPVDVNGSRNVEYALQTNNTGAHTHSVPVAAHTHSVAIGDHSHTVTGSTAAMGSGSAITITPEFINLMAWMRTE